MRSVISQQRRLRRINITWHRNCSTQRDSSLMKGLISSQYSDLFHPRPPVEWPWTVNYQQKKKASKRKNIYQTYLALCLQACDWTFQVFGTVSKPRLSQHLAGGVSRQPGRRIHALCDITKNCFPENINLVFLATNVGPFFYSSLSVLGWVSAAVLHSSTGSWRLLCQVCPHNPRRTQTPGSHYCWQMEAAPSVLERPWDFKVQLNPSWAHLKALKSVILINSLSLLWLYFFLKSYEIRERSGSVTQTSVGNTGISHLKPSLFTHLQPGAFITQRQIQIHYYR